MTDEQLPDPPDLAVLGTQFGEISRMLAASDGQVDPQLVVSLASKAVPHAQHCGITLLHADGAPESVAISDELPGHVDALQYRLHEGPCLDASEGDDLVVCEEMATDERWPAFGPACAAMGVRSMLCVRVLLVGSDRAALNFYSVTPSAFDDLDAGVASIFGPFAAMAINQVVRDREVATLGAALGSSREIGTAIGILMTRYKVTSERAFGLLSEASQHLNQKLRDVASAVTLTGELPPLDGRGGQPAPQQLEPEPG